MGKTRIWLGFWLNGMAGHGGVGFFEAANPVGPCIGMHYRFDFIDFLEGEDDLVCRLRWWVSCGLSFRSKLGLINEAPSSAHTGFLESYRHGPKADVGIQVVEGIKGGERLPVEVVAGTLPGHYFPVTVEPHSRCATIAFANVRAVFTFAET